MKMSRTPSSRGDVPLLSTTISRTIATSRLEPLHRGAMFLCSRHRPTPRRPLSAGLEPLHRGAMFLCQAWNARGEEKLNVSNPFIAGRCSSDPAPHSAAAGESHVSNPFIAGRCSSVALIAVGLWLGFRSRTPSSRGDVPLAPTSSAGGSRVSVSRTPSSRGDVPLRD